MLPEHGHIHISTPALFFSLIFIASIVTIVFAFVRSIKRDRLAAERAWEALRNEELAARVAQRTQHIDAVTGQPYRSYGAAAPAAPVVHPAPLYTAPAYAPAYGMDPGLALVEGMLIGEALSGHGHTTIINEGPSYVDTSPSYDSGSNYDSGSSFDTDTSGGFSVDW